jgi:hypothetical protein
MGQIVTSPQVEHYLNNRVDILYYKEYFGFIENAEKYVDRLTGDIEKHLIHKTHKTTPKRLLKRGIYYAAFRINKHTTWYVFFDKKGNRYFIEYITNNHMPEAAILAMQP